MLFFLLIVALLAPASRPSAVPATRPTSAQIASPDGSFSFDCPASLKPTAVPAQIKATAKVMRAEVAADGRGVVGQLLVLVSDEPSGKAYPPEYAKIIVEQMLPQLRRANFEVDEATDATLGGQYARHVRYHGTTSGKSVVVDNVIAVRGTKVYTVGRNALVPERADEFFKKTQGVIESFTFEAKGGE